MKLITLLILFFNAITNTYKKITRCFTDYYGVKYIDEKGKVRKMSVFIFLINIILIKIFNYNTIRKIKLIMIEKWIDDKIYMMIFENGFDQIIRKNQIPEKIDICGKQMPTIFKINGINLVNNVINYEDPSLHFSNTVKNILLFENIKTSADDMVEYGFFDIENMKTVTIRERITEIMEKNINNLFN